MAKDELTGNMPTEKLITYFNDEHIEIGVDTEHFDIAYKEAANVFL